MRINNENLLFIYNSLDETPEHRKSRFLDRLRGTKKRYKRYVGSTLRYAGGKSWAVGYIVDHIPSTIQRLVSPFVGGASVEIAVAKEIGIPVMAYDIFDILVNYWQIQITKPEELYSILAKLKPDNDTYKYIRQELKDHWLGKKNLDRVTLAAYYYFNHNLSYGPGFLGWL